MRTRKKLKIAPSRNQIDKPLLWLTILLSAIGVLAVADASAPLALATFGTPYYFAKQQLMWTVIGLVGLAIAANIHYSYWKRIGFVVGTVSAVLLLVVLIPGIGSKIFGARSWINLGPFSFQPSEVTKFALAVVMAKLIDEKYPFKYAVYVVAGACALVMLQPDLGTTIVIASVGFVLLFVGGIPIAHLIATAAAGAFSALLFTLTSDYRRARLMTFFESSSDPLGNSYHMRQILIALGSGGLFGVGIGQSRQKHLFLPETASDSVFAVIAEETGFIGSLLVIFLLLLFILRILKVANSAPDNFSKMLGSGIAFWFAAQMFLNLSSVVAVTPLTGIPLPFFSYGGTSLITILCATGIILNISRYAEKKR